jgi:hypothetical protein
MVDGLPGERIQGVGNGGEVHVFFAWIDSESVKRLRTFLFQLDLKRRKGYFNS